MEPLAAARGGAAGRRAKPCHRARPAGPLPRPLDHPRRPAAQLHQRHRTDARRLSVVSHLGRLGPLQRPVVHPVRPPPDPGTSGWRASRLARRCPRTPRGGRRPGQPYQAGRRGRLGAPAFRARHGHQDPRRARRRAVGGHRDRGRGASARRRHHEGAGAAGRRSRRQQFRYRRRCAGAALVGPRGRPPPRRRRWLAARRSHRPARRADHRAGQRWHPAGRWQRPRRLRRRRQRGSAGVQGPRPRPRHREHLAPAAGRCRRAVDRHAHRRPDALDRERSRAPRRGAGPAELAHRLAVRRP